ncbi:MAG TPA: DoxX family membrane protein [Phycisphaerae bacterium]|nr:DoxX family membrane protein [Phycisphaerae bacterium]HRY69332.1 DoxX family membrane protein [Phycisphaerae bacterium]HSA26650.1 DoxX family membrane protein [Phycisphaerae bacterium]
MSAAAAGSQKSLMDLVLLLNRLALGLYFVLAGVHKISAEGGVAQFYRTVFLSMKPAWLPVWFAAPYGYALPFLEVIVGGLLGLGALGRWPAGAMSLMLASFTIALYENGKFFSDQGPFHANVILLTSALLLTMTGHGAISVDAFRKKGAAQ